MAQAASAAMKVDIPPPLLRRICTGSERRAPTSPGANGTRAMPSTLQSTWMPRSTTDPAVMARRIRGSSKRSMPQMVGTISAKTSSWRILGTDAMHRVQSARAQRDQSAIGSPVPNSAKTMQTKPAVRMLLMLPVTDSDPRSDSSPNPKATRPQPTAYGTPRAGASRAPAFANCDTSVVCMSDRKSAETTHAPQRPKALWATVAKLTEAPARTEAATVMSATMRDWAKRKAQDPTITAADGRAPAGAVV
mmetsp:Transcript_140567/g.244705  ORF Transcript_140567/g.244705 Transcript_140567/m.244705 type:complete len:249 (-) Transcript_140567:113-859(-)